MALDPLGIGLLLLLLGGRKPAPTPGGLSTSPSAPAGNLPSGRGSGPFVDAWRKRTADLMRRAMGGARWAARMSVLLGSPAAGAAAARWFGIESGGNPLANSKLGERGLAQVMQTSAKELGITAADWADMANPQTSEDMHATIAAKVIAGELAMTARAGYRAPDPGWGPAVAPNWGNLKSVNGIGIGKLRHGLPLLARELDQQKLLRPSIAETVAVARGTFKPSERLARYAGGAHALTKNPGDDLLLRFLASAAVVALGEPAIGIASNVPGAEV